MTHKEYDVPLNKLRKSHVARQLKEQKKQRDLLEYDELEIDAGFDLYKEEQEIEQPSNRLPEVYPPK